MNLGKEYRLIEIDPLTIPEEEPSFVPDSPADLPEKKKEDVPA